MRTTLHRLYWTEDDETWSQDFTEIGDLLKASEELRKRAREGADIRFITSAAENSDCTSLQGVAAPAADYNWEKRRGGRR